MDLSDVTTMSDAFVFDPIGGDITVEWEIVQQPPAVVAQFGGETELNTTFKSDQAGNYTLGLTAANSWVSGEQATVRISAVDPDVIFRSGFE